MLWYSLKINRRLLLKKKKKKGDNVNTNTKLPGLSIQALVLGLLEHFSIFLDLQRPLECPSENADLLAVNLRTLTLLDFHSSFLWACLGVVHRPPGGPWLEVKAHCFRQFFSSTSVFL